jgi:glutamine synthetase
MHVGIDDVLKLVKDQKIEMVDLKFVDLNGRWRHITIPSKALFVQTFSDGVAVDGSSIGFKSVKAGDMVVIPDSATAKMDPFWEAKTLSMICNGAEADTKAPFALDPRGIARKAEEYLKSSGIGDESQWSPEYEFHLFDNVNYHSDINSAYYFLDSVEAEWNSGKRGEQNLGHQIPLKGGYHSIPPLDQMYNLRTEMVKIIQEGGIEVRYHHHEVGGPGQEEIEIRFYPLLEAADASMWIKYIIRMVAQRHNKTATLMPKPLYGEAGNGMHFHQKMFKNGKPVFYDPSGYAGLSQIALNYIGGVLSHGPSLTAFTNPSTNSFKRLIPGFEAPVNLFFSLANRSAAIRIPKYAILPEEKDFEYRPPDATCNIYLAMSAILMAGIDGIKKKIDPTKAGFGPFDIDIDKVSKEEKAKIKPLPSSLKSALEALQDDHQYLLEGGVFSKILIEGWIERKMKEYYEIRNRPHPYEWNLYYEA